MASPSSDDLYDYHLQPKTPPPEPPNIPQPRPTQPETILFESGNPETRSVIRGSLDVTIAAPGSIPSSEKEENGSKLPDATPATIVVESIPGLMSSADFCKFVRPFLDSILHFRALRYCTEPNRYMVVIKFESAATAEAFATECQGKYYLRGLVQETCSIRTVSAIRFETEPKQESSTNAALPFPTGAMFPSANDDSATGTSGNTQPTCPVCLEKLDERALALVTVFCNHTMHAACLAQWDLNRCPVCRHMHELSPEATECMACGRLDDVWMCMICGFVGCGFSTSKHANDHFRETLHPFASNLSERTFWTGDTLPARSVWDYISERFVSRLVVSDDGKVVEVDSTGAGTGNGSGNGVDGVGAGGVFPGGAASTGADSAWTGGGRADSCCGGASSGGGVAEGDAVNDRTYQAAIYASGMDAVADQYRTRIERLEAEHKTEVDALQSQVAKLKHITQEQSKERKTQGKKLNESEKETRRLRDQNEFLKNLNETLLRDKQAWNEEVERLKGALVEAQASKAGLEEQLRDVMLHLEAQTRIAGGASSASGSGEGCTSGNDSCRRTDVSELHGADVVRVGPSRRERLAMKTNRRYPGS